MRKLIMLAAIALLALTACGKTSAVRDPDGTGAAANRLSVKGHEYMFDVSGTAKTGRLSMEFTNTGKELHHAIVGRLGDGKTLEDFKTEVLGGSQDSGPPEWFDDSPIDSNVLSPGRSQTVTFPVTDAGTYVLVCFMPSPDGAPHATKGMVTSFEVEGSSEAAAPKADHTIDMVEYTFKGVGAIKAGDVTLEVRNAGKENHEFILLKFAEGKTIPDIDAWFEGGAQGPPPATFIGGTHDYAPGQSVFFTATLDPGTYTLVCGVETDDGKNHADDLGMITEFTVA